MSEHDHNKSEADKLRGLTRDTNAARRLRRRVEKDDPDTVTEIDAACEAVETLERAPRKRTGRPPGSKSRSPQELGALRLARILATKLHGRKGRVWFDSLNEHSQVQLVKTLGPLITKDAEQPRDLEVVVRHEDRGLPAPDEDAERQGVEQLKAPNVEPLESDREPAITMTTPVTRDELTVDMILSAVRDPDPSLERDALRALIEESAKELNLQLQDRAREAREAERRLNELGMTRNRMRILDDDSAWEGGW